MTVFLMIAFLFFTGSLLGWCLEVLYRRFSPANKSRRWINPGFLIGPYLPLYGFGLIALYLMASLENTSLIAEVTVGSKILLFAIMSVVMTAMEYVAGLIFIKGMNIKLWDYSNEKFNLQGIICLKFSFYWAILGAVYYFLIHPHITNALIWFSNNIAFSFVIGMFYGIIIIDFGYSMGVMAKIRKFAADNQIKVKLEELKLQIREDAELHMQKVHWFMQYRSEAPIWDHLMRHLELQTAFVTKEIVDKYQDVEEEEDLYQRH